MAETIEEAYQRGRRDMAKQVFALTEDTFEKFDPDMYATMAASDLQMEHSRGFARGERDHAKRVAKAIAAVL